jgi:hypothetical protein
MLTTELTTMAGPLHWSRPIPTSPSLTITATMSPRLPIRPVLRARIHRKPSATGLFSTPHRLPARRPRLNRRCWNGAPACSPGARSPPPTFHA